MTPPAGDRPGFRLADGLVLAGFLFLFYLCRGSVLNGDPLLAWPITDSLMHPGRYPPGDLIVEAGSKGNFLLYKALAAFPFLRDNLPLRDFLLYLPIFFLYLVAWWHVFVVLGADRIVAAASTAFLLFADDKLGLNWSFSPLPYLISSTSVQFLEVAGLGLFFAGRRMSALVVTGISGWFHPPSALAYGAAYSAMLGVEAARKKDLRALSPVPVFAAIVLPVFLLIAKNSQGAFAVDDRFFRIFELFSYHAYLDTHFREGYAYTFAVILILRRLFREDSPVLRHRDAIFLFIAVAVAGSAAWLLNLYVVRNVQAVQAFFIMRIFYLVKPLIVFLVVTASFSLYAGAGNNRDRAAVLLFLATLLNFSPPVALIAATGFALYAAGNRRWAPITGSLFAAYLVLAAAIYRQDAARAVWRSVWKGMDGNEMNLFQVVLFLGIAAFLLRAPPLREPRTHGARLSGGNRALLAVPIAVLLAFSPIPSKAAKFIRKSAAGESILNFRPGEYWGIRTKDPKYAELLDWARSSGIGFFVVPPYDDRFLGFRYLAGKGIYGHQWDICQLAYSPRYYSVGYNRLLTLGLDASGAPKYRWKWNYESRCDELVANLDADAIVFEKKRLGGKACSEKAPLFENDEFVAYSGLRRAK